MDSGFKGTGYEVAMVYKGNGTFVSYNHLMAEECNNHFEVGQTYVLEEKKMSVEKSITWQQKKSLFLWHTKMSNALNDAGHDMRAVFNKMRPGTSVPCTKERLKLCVWDEFMVVMYGIKSITKLTTKQTQELYETCNNFYATRFGVGIPWPDRWSQMYEQEQKALEEQRER